MDDIENGLSALTKSVVDKRVQGYTVEEIAEKTGLSTIDVVKTWKEYVEARTVESPEEQWVLHLLRLEGLLVKVNQRLDYAQKAEDFEVVIKLLDRVEMLQGLNIDRKRQAEDALSALTAQQMQIILSALFQMQQGFKELIDETISRSKTIKAIRGELVDNFDANFTPIAQSALEQAGDEK